ncbi:hypothetical protein ANCCEY_02151 [Ancylostoma ceylanicum]|uniref:Uncharacterized protein n=1 Tax=Ancylostoma ceylanicum TaxID=53326 RepID=A0A0D6M8K3_9BILA|nr:hypothetical protein ANCCEY_02151 [Ancylostoma ceylanicum]
MEKQKKRNVAKRIQDVDILRKWRNDRYGGKRFHRAGQLFLELPVTSNVGPSQESYNITS